MLYYRQSLARRIVHASSAATATEHQRRWLLPLRHLHGGEGGTVGLGGRGRSAVVAAAMAKVVMESAAVAVAAAMAAVAAVAAVKVRSTVDNILIFISSLPRAGF